ncbi:unnamed protein product, partial [Aureobasidium uvarum]
MDARVKRKRIVGSKYSRHACRTCRYGLTNEANLTNSFLTLSRIRKIKCDEGKDSCNNCISTGRICDGYSVIVPDGRNVAPRPLLPASKALTFPSICARPSAYSFTLHDAQGHALDFFRRITIHQLPCASAFETPWESVALDLMHGQPSLAAAACACAALHRATTDSPDGDRTQYQFALQQYNNSSLLMRKYIDDLDDNTSESATLVVLAVCLLFFTYETFLGDDAKAAIHLHTGLRIIHERLRPRENGQQCNGKNVIMVDHTSTSLFSVFVRAFVRLDSDYMLIGFDEPHTAACSAFSNPDEASLHLETITAKIFDVYDLIAQRAFQRLEDSEFEDIETLDEDQQICLMRAAIRFSKLSQSLEEAVVDCKQSLHAWTKAFRMVPQTSANLRSHISTQLFFFCVHIWIETWHDVNACLVDRFAPQFAYFTDLCEQYLDLHTARTPHHNTFVGCNGTGEYRFYTPPAFSLGSGVVTCLATIVEKCRTSSIRRRCIGLLRKINLRGVFDTNYLATYLQAIIDHEEQAAQLQHPDLDFSNGLKANEVNEDARLLEVIMSPARHRSRFEFYKSNRVNAVFVTNGREMQLGRLTACVSRETPSS